MHYVLVTKSKNSSGEEFTVEMDIIVRASKNEGEGFEPTDVVDDVIEDCSDEFVDGIMNLLGENLHEEIGPLERPTFTKWEHAKQLRTY